jgi:hypothetical protein
MQNRNLVFRLLSLTLIISMTFLVGCGGYPKLIEREKIYGTSGEDLSIFHRVAERDGGLGLKYPGYLIGIEKALREKIDFNDVEEIFNEEILGNNEDYIANVKKIIGKRQKKRTFISHIVEYSSGNSNYKDSIPYIKERFIFNAYDKNVDPKGIYSQGLKKLDELKGEIGKNLKNGTQYTHIFLYSMGWNTDQQESFRNYNSLLAQMIKSKNRQESFNPLFIGISWPSEWRWKYFGDIVRLLSYGNKADDADEVGLIWVNKVLREILVPIKKDAKDKGKDIPLILIGHSFGARVITRAVFSNGLVEIEIGDESTENIHTGNPFSEPETSEPEEIDLVIGLQGAFSINRFIPEESEEGAPYSEFSKYSNKFVFTWSRHDFANPVARWITGARHIGGLPGYKQSQKKEFRDKFDHFTIEVDSNINNSYDVDYVGIKESQEWEQSFSERLKISIVDATNLVKNKPYGKGGNAHSDIFTPGIASFIWDCISNLKNN